MLSLKNQVTTEFWAEDRRLPNVRKLPDVTGKISSLKITLELWMDGFHIILHPVVDLCNLMLVIFKQTQNKCFAV